MYVEVLLVYFHIKQKTITSNSGHLYIGDTVTFNIYEILTGFDDENYPIENYWTSSDDRYETESLKRLKD